MEITKSKKNKIEDFKLKIWTVTLNVSGLNIPVKDRLTECSLKHMKQLYAIYKKLKIKVIGRMKVKVYEKIYHASKNLININGNI
jgi:hypothetical protein